jgi:kynureninase
MTDFARTKNLFHLPEGIVYLDGNSLGPLPKAAMARLAQAAQDEWGGMLIGAWNKAGWMDMPGRLGDRIGKLIGALPGTVVLGDTLSVKIYQALASALGMRPERKVILSDTGNFPSDLYMAEGLAGSLNRGHALKTVPPEALEAAIDGSVAALLVTEVDYRTGRRHDMARLTAKAHSAGALVIWDLAHSAGAFPVDLASSHADFAAGCTYKYLNGGPGAPAFVYVRPDHIDHVRPALSGWLGHAEPFAFDLGYRPASGIERLRIGTPPILQMAALEAALDVWDAVDLTHLRRRCVELSELLISECERRCPELKLASPRDADQRGSQVSFHFTDGYSAMRALIDHGVIGDFRAPDIMRFGITPLYIDEADILKAAEMIGAVMDGKLWELPKYQMRLGVT